MIVFPAIDLLGGKCVRLSKGEYSSASKVAEDPVATAESFWSAGAEYLHMVDLDGARAGAGQLENRRVVREICKRGWFPVELGGGIRTLDDIARALDNGVSRVILGSSATDLTFLQEAIHHFGTQLAVGIDAKEGVVATAGWTQTSGLPYLEFAKQVASLGISNVIFTDIGRDGMLSGPNLEALVRLQQTIPNTCITASGGVKSIDDIRNLHALSLYGAICGKSLYAGTLDLSEAIREAKA